jgi:oligoribonuclease NrnB/cAMP/cGMP phosphodiesterase (DHH superfamily)
LSGTAWEEITSTGKVSQSYDLWHHGGEEKHVNTYLSMFFKEWERSNRDKFNTMQTSPEQSHALMLELVQSWAVESLDSKLSIGEASTAEHGKQCRALCETAYEVKLPVVGYDKVKIGFIPGENLKVSVSTLGSIAVREYGWDVMVMIAAVKDNCYILSLRSNESGTNVDVADICDQIGKGPFGLTGGGHRNAAGCTIQRDDLQEVASKVLSL